MGWRFAGYSDFSGAVARPRAMYNRGVADTVAPDRRAGMRVAVVTPCYQTPAAWAARCLESVAAQTVPCTHFFVLDGDPAPPVELHAAVRVLTLPGPHHDTGNAARAAGSVAAVCQGFDAIAYLDSD